MKKYSVYLLISYTFVFFISCNGNKQQTENNEVQTPKALQDDSGLKSLKRGGNLITELYNELVEKSPELKKLETDLEEFQNIPSETQNIFFNYNGKSNIFYGNAEGFANQIKDSLTKKRILEIIKRSNDKYNLKSKDIDQLVKQISSSETTIEDNHNVLKIALTIPLIEKFQDENLPKKDKFVETISKQKELNNQILSNTPKN